MAVWMAAASARTVASLAKPSWFSTAKRQPAAPVAAADGRTRPLKAGHASLSAASRALSAARSCSALTLARRVPTSRSGGAGVRLAWALMPLRCAITSDVASARSYLLACGGAAGCEGVRPRAMQEWQRRARVRTVFGRRTRQRGARG